MRSWKATWMAFLVFLSWGTATATRYMTLEELEAQQATIQKPRPVPSPKLALPVYREAIARTARFMANMQVSDSASSDFGGVREAEDDLNTIQTDNTQEGIWVWSRYRQLFGTDSFRVNIHRAWTYVQRYPPWREEGSPGVDYYRDWNCGLGLFAESKYREVYGDSTYIHAYTDTCISYLNSHPLSYVQSGYQYVNAFVNAYYSGMLYRYWRDRGVQAYHDTAVARGTLVKNWIVVDAQRRLQYNIWAMSGGTALWGACNSVLQEDTTAAKAWLSVYVDSMDFFRPTGNWNNSWNIYRAWAYRAAWEIGHVPQWQTNHKRLLDTLLAQDQDLDGGIPDTWNDSSNTDAAWTSSYLDFMGLDYYFEPTGLAEGNLVEPRGVEAGLKGVPNPFHSFAAVPGHEAEVFALYDVAGRRIGTFKGNCIGKGLSAGIYFMKPIVGPSRPCKIVKIR